MSGWKFPLLALLFLAFCNTCGSASADEYVLDITGFGDVDITSYASEYGEAEFVISVISLSGDHTNVDISASFDDGSWSAEQVSFTDCNGGNVSTSLVEGETISACITVSIQESGAEVGDSTSMTVSVTSDEVSNSDSMEFTILVSNWFAYSDDGAQTFEIDTTHAYTITVENIEVDENGNGVAISDPISISLSTVGPGWNIDSDDSAWDKAELTATINYIAADDSYDLVLDIELASSLVPASSYVGNSFIIFTVQDGTVYTLVSLEAIVSDHFETEIIGSGDTYVDNGCEDSEAAIDWSPIIKNFGNTMDSFSVNFDTSDADAVGWTVDGATDSNTGNLGARFESPENEYSLNLGLHVPGGLPSGTSHGFTMTVTSDTDSSVTQIQSFSATVIQCYGLTMTVDKASDSANPGSPVDFTLTIENTGNGEDTMEFQTMGASEWQPTLSESEMTVASEVSAQVVLTLTVPDDASANAASGSVMVHAHSEGGEGYEQDVSVSVTANQVYSIVAGYYSNETGVEKDTASMQGGMTVQMKFTVTNDGNGNDEITLSLANAPTWVTLGQTVALAGPGQTLTLTIDVAAPSDALGEHTFQVTTTSADGMTSSTTGDLTVTIILNEYGCTNPNALNYRQDAIYDDGSCMIGGCTDDRTAEYNPNATFDDGSCPPVIIGCMNSTAVNYRPMATVEEGNCKYAPTAVAGSDISVVEGEVVQFSGAGTDEEGPITKYEWDFDGDGIYEWSSGENGRTTNIYNAAGEYSTSLRVTDADGNTAVDERIVTVTASPQAKEEADSTLPSLSLISVLGLICLSAVLRRR